MFLNGVSLGKKVVKPYQHVEWNVKYAPGKLVAKGIRRGKTIEAVRETTGTPASILLTADRAKILRTTRMSQSLKLKCWMPKVGLCRSPPTKSISTSKARGKSSASATAIRCHEPDKASERSAFNGLAQVIVQATKDAGKIKLTATADGLAPATTL